MSSKEDKQAVLASICFLLSFYLPPFMNARYTNALFLLWLPLLIIDIKLFKLKQITIFTIAIIATISLVKSVHYPAFFRDGLIFSLYYPLVVICGFISGKKMSESGNLVPKVIVGVTLVSQAVLCLMQIYNREIGLLSVRLYSLDKYTDTFTFFRSPKSIGTFGNHNYLAFIFLLSILLFVTYFNNKKSILLFLSVTLFLLAMLSTGSRAGFLFLVIFISLFFFLRVMSESKKRRENLVLFPIVIMLMVLSILLFVTRGVELFNKVTAFFNRGVPEYGSWKEVFDQERVAAWSNAEISQMGTTEFLFGRSFKTRITTDNLYLSLLIMYGLIGMILILILTSSVILTISSGAVSSRARIVSYCLLIVFVISGVVADYWFNSSITPIYFFIIGSLLEEINKRYNKGGGNHEVTTYN